MRLIATHDDVATGLAALVAADRRLAPVLDVAGEVPLRRFEPGYAGLARVVVGQQLSIHAAAAIWGRLEGEIGAVTPAALLGVDDATLKRAGLSIAKMRTLRAVAADCAAGTLDLAAIAEAEPGVAIARLVELPGVGPWTAELFLIFCAGHPDVFPGGDLALRVALADAFGLAERPDDKGARAIAAEWAPWRSVAARLLWAFYGRRRAGGAIEPV
jgi:DNA-3-methyladenine glycosylase II